MSASRWSRLPTRRNRERLRDAAAISITSSGRSPSVQISPASPYSPLLGPPERLNAMAPAAPFPTAPRTWAMAERSDGHRMPCWATSPFSISGKGTTTRYAISAMTRLLSDNKITSRTITSVEPRKQGRPPTGPSPSRGPDSRNSLASAFSATRRPPMSFLGQGGRPAQRIAALRTGNIHRAANHGASSKQERHSLRHSADSMHSHDLHAPAFMPMCLKLPPTKFPEVSIA